VFGIQGWHQLSESLRHRLAHRYQEMKFFTLLVVIPWVLTRILKHWMDYRHSREPKLDAESEIERALNDDMANKRFESTWNLIADEEKESRKNPRWRTPEEMLVEEQLERKHGPWKPTIPGFLHDDAR